MDSQTATSTAAKITSPLRREWVLLLSFITTALFLMFGKGWMENLAQPLWFTFILAWLFCVILASAFAIVRHAESLAILFGEPLGTLILTLSAITNEDSPQQATGYQKENRLLMRNHGFSNSSL
jgi:hypothetical protein